MAKSAKAKKADATATPAKKGVKGRFTRAQDAKSSKQAKAKAKQGKGKQARGKAKTGKGGKAAPKGKGGNRAIQFLREVKVEMSKVTWPTRDELVQSTVAVLVAVLITGVFIFLLDVLFSRLIGLVS